MERGAQVEGRWEDCYEVIRPHMDDHVLTFNDNHILLACLGANNQAAVEQMMTSIQDWVASSTGDQSNITKEIGLVICRAFVAYRAGDCAQAVELMYPVRYLIWKIGGSHAQVPVDGAEVGKTLLADDGPADAESRRVNVLPKRVISGASSIPTDGFPLSLPDVGKHCRPSYHVPEVVPIRHVPVQDLLRKVNLRLRNTENGVGETACVSSGVRNEYAVAACTAAGTAGAVRYIFPVLMRGALYVNSE
ncbi:TTC38-like protein [Mya arenaria]|uniref:TTC38-like protein n=1 Tax=Mya arenaria TaxID=6604 RepID=A0ABY7F123_MYAAR|nr:TTC38-like protein [Mya arenaria]